MTRWVGRMMRSSARRRDQWIDLPRADLPIRELAVPAGDVCVHHCDVEQRERVCGVAFAQMVPRDELRRDQVPATGRREAVIAVEPFVDGRQLLWRARVGDSSHLGEPGQKRRGPECGWRTGAKLRDVDSQPRTDLSKTGKLW